jgi:RNA polymerase sigma-70 factor (ECF subfamily)
LQKTDTELVKETLNGILSSFDRLIKRHEQQVYRLAYRFANDNDYALDITQDVFIKVFEHLNQFKEKSEFKTWLMRITFNECQNWAKKNQYKIENRSIEELEMKYIDTINQEDEVIAKENRVMLMRSLYQLNTKHRLAIVLRYYEDFSIGEIAGVLKCSEGVVKNILFRCLKKLKQNLNHVQIGSA